MEESRIVSKLLESYGPLGVVGGAFLVILLRFGPHWIASLREKRLQSLSLRTQREQELASEKARLIARLDQKDAYLEKILTNHIAHLEDRSKAQLEFEKAAVEQLQAMTHKLRELRIDQVKTLEKVDEINGDVREIKGRVS